MGDWQNMVLEIMKSRFTGLINDRTACIAAYERHNQEVINNVSKDRLIVWNIGDGWEPLCKALNLPLPSRSFPHENTRQEFIQRLS